MKVIANRQLCGDYGHVTAGQEFEARDDVAEHLLKAGLVYQPAAKKTYETKVVVPMTVPVIEPAPDSAVKPPLVIELAKPKPKPTPTPAK